MAKSKAAWTMNQVQIQSELQSGTVIFLKKNHQNRLSVTFRALIVCLARGLDHSFFLLSSQGTAVWPLLSWHHFLLSFIISSPPSTPLEMQHSSPPSPYPSFSDQTLFPSDGHIPMVSPATWMWRTGEPMIGPPDMQASTCSLNVTAEDKLSILKAQISIGYPHPVLSTCVNAFITAKCAKSGCSGGFISWVPSSPDLDVHQASSLQALSPLPSFTDTILGSVSAGCWVHFLAFLLTSI